MAPQKEKTRQKVRYALSDRVIMHYRALLEDLSVEQFYIVFLDGDLQVIQEKRLQVGTGGEVSFSLSEILQDTLDVGAASVILLHNHPAGMCRPSGADIKMTRLLAEVFAPLHIRIYDHLIVTADNYYSFRAHHLIYDESAVPK